MRRSTRLAIREPDAGDIGAGVPLYRVPPIDAGANSDADANDPNDATPDVPTYASGAG